MQTATRRQTHLSWSDAHALAAARIEEPIGAGCVPRSRSSAGEPYRAYGIPRGGWNAVQLVCRDMLVPVDRPEDADLFVDDIIDSGETRRRVHVHHGDKPFFALIDKTNPDCPYLNDWVVFPWEGAREAMGPEENVRRILQYLGENPDREGLRETPARFLKMLKELTRGLHEDPALHLAKRFPLDDDESGLTAYDGIIQSGPLPFVSLCEHHLALFEGTAWIGYIPHAEGSVVGLSKFARMLDGYAFRPQVQERLTIQVADAIERELSPLALGVVIRGRHTCQCVRGVRKDGRMMTSAMRGVFRESPEARAEFMAMITLSNGNGNLLH